MSEVDNNLSILRVAAGAGAGLYLLGGIINIFSGKYDFHSFGLGLIQVAAAIVMFSSEFSPFMLNVLYPHFPFLVEYMGRGLVYITFALLAFGNNFFSGLAAWVLLFCGVASIYFHTKIPASHENPNERLIDPNEIEHGKEYVQ